MTNQEMQRSIEIDVPEDLIWALDTNEAAKARFERLSNSHRREYIDWIEGARKPETRQRRIQQALEMIMRGKQ